MSRSSTMIILSIIVLSIILIASCSKTLERQENQQAGPMADDAALIKSQPSEPVQEKTSQQPTPRPEQKRQPTRLSLPSCNDAPPLFNITPLQFSGFTHLIPLGFLDPPTTVFPSSRMHYVIRRTDPENYTSIPLSVPVVAPMDMVITRIKAHDYRTKSDLDSMAANPYRSYAPDHTDYTLYFTTCNDIEFFFDYLIALEPNILDEYIKDFRVTSTCTENNKGTIKQSTLCEKDVNIPISAGERIGTAGGRENQFSLDLGVVDRTKPKLPYASPGRWEENPDTPYLGCPFTFFSETLQLNHTRAKNIGIGDGVGPVLEKPRTTEPLCGEIEQDESGTAQGVWFDMWPEDAKEEEHIALVHDVIDPQRGVFSIGTSFTDYNIPPGAYSFLPTQDTSDERTNVDFGLITADGNVYCYENLVDQQNNRMQNLILLITMPKPTTLVIEKVNEQSCGSKEWKIIKPIGLFER